MITNIHTPVVLVGYSGHGLVVGDAAIEAGLAVKFYAEKTAASANPFELEYLGFEADDSFAGWGKGYVFIAGIGDNKIRDKIAAIIASKGEQLATVIHPAAVVARKVEIGIGSFIARNVSISPLAIIGNNCVINTGCIVEHECRIGTAVHIAPGAVLAGNVTVGDFSFIGANAVIRQGIRIGTNALIGAGTVVINDIADNETWVGNPARRIR